MLACPTVDARAQSAADTLAIEIALARYIKPTVSETDALESRVNVAELGKPAAERPSAPELAKVLGLPIARIEDVLGCSTGCRSKPVGRIVILSRPSINGDSARAYVSFRLIHDGKLFMRSTEYLLTRTDGVWQVKGPTGKGVIS
jgi:hypothetical protein